MKLSGNSGRPVPLHKRSASHFQRGDRQRGEDIFRAVELAIWDYGPIHGFDVGYTYF